MTITEALNDTTQAQRWNETQEMARKAAAVGASQHDVYIPGGLANGADHIIWRAPNRAAAEAEVERVLSEGGPRYSVKPAA